MVSSTEERSTCIVQYGPLYRQEEEKIALGQRTGLKRQVNAWRDLEPAPRSAVQPDSCVRDVCSKGC